MKHFLKYFIGIIAIAAVSCDSSNEPILSETGKDYYPLQKNLFQIYDVSEIRYQLGIPETLAYELKTLVADSFLTVDGDVEYVIYRSQRNSGETEWTYLDTWSARINNQEAIMNEENISYLKIKFPLFPGTVWNGNTYNTYDKDEYTLEEIDKPYTINQESFPDCIVVQQSDNEEYIVFLDQRQEIYAMHVGLIYKETTQLRYYQGGQQIVESGVIYKQAIKAYGLE